MRLFKLNRKYKFNWKYVIGEILLIFIGINLAIWFNNWNTSKQADSNKQLAIDKISEEIRNNLEELEEADSLNSHVLNAYLSYKPSFDGKSSILIASSALRDSLLQLYPEFFKATDSVALEDGRYRYGGDTFVQLEIPELNSIAWETSRNLGITNEFDYECLYAVETIYNLQRRVLTQADNLTDALQSGKGKELFDMLNIAGQLNSQLISQYREALESVDDCR